MANDSFNDLFAKVVPLKGASPSVKKESGKSSPSRKANLAKADQAAAPKAEKLASQIDDAEQSKSTGEVLMEELGSAAANLVKSVTPDKPSKKVEVSKDSILQNIHNEHRYQTQIFAAFREQYEILKQGGKPDYALMYDVMHYINEFPYKYQYPREHAVFRALLRHDESYRADVESLFIEHETLENKSAAIIDTLEQLLEEETEGLKESLRIRSKDFMNYNRKHINHKHGKMMPVVEKVLSDAEWKPVIREVSAMREAPSMNKTLQKRYESLHDYISRRVERATEDFALAELIGLGAIFESIGTFGNCFGEIKDVFRKHIKLTSDRSGRAYKNLRKSGSWRIRDYSKVSADAFLDAFDHYADATKEVSHILRKTRHQLAEPYAQRMKIFQQITREEEAEALAKAAGILEDPILKDPKQA